VVVEVAPRHEVEDDLRRALDTRLDCNAHAHGGRRIDEPAAKRLRDVGMTAPARGDLVVLDYATVKVFRGRLRTLMDRGGVSRKES
jgi:hypothetical protein